MHKKIFEEYPVPKAIATLALPTILGMLVNIIYNMADTFFVGQTQDKNQVAAITLCLPIFMFFMSIGNIFGVGGGAYISRLLGEKNYEKIKNVSSFCFYACIVISILCTLLFNFFIEDILRLLGTSEATYYFTKSYLIILSYGAVFICLQMVFSGMVRSEGSSKQAMIGMMIGTILNIVLDPIMIFSMKLGVIGAGLATIIGNIASCIYYIIYILIKKSTLCINPKSFVIKSEIIKNILIIGIPVSINTILISFANIILNNFASSYNEGVVAALGIANRVANIAIMLLLGLAQGSQPFIGYNFAAKNYHRMNQAIRFGILCSIIIGSSIFLGAFLFSEQIVTAFLKEVQVIDYGKYFIKATMAVTPILGIQFIFMSSFQAMGKGLPALIVSLSRQGLAFIPALIIGNKLFGLNGIVWAQPFADLVSIFVSAIMYVAIYKKIKINKN